MQNPRGKNLGRPITRSERFQRKLGVSLAIVVTLIAPATIARDASGVIYNTIGPPLPADVQMLVIFQPDKDGCEQLRLDRPCKRPFYNDVFPYDPDSMN
jgi:hypothetical protein